MSSQHLVRLIQDYLDAEMLLGRSGPLTRAVQEHRWADTRHRVEDYISTAPHDDADRPLAQAAEAYLEAVSAYDEARVAGTVSMPSSQLLYEADGDLQDALYQSVRGYGSQPVNHVRRILVAVNDDTLSQRVLYTAVHLAEGLPATLRLLHVIDEIEASVTPHGTGLIDGLQGARDAAALLAHQRAEVPDDISCDTLVRSGNPTLEIVSAARRWGADFIVMGLHAGGRLTSTPSADQLVGVLALAPCPVIVVGRPGSKKRSNDELEHTPVEAEAVAACTGRCDRSSARRENDSNRRQASPVLSTTETNQ